MITLTIWHNVARDGQDRPTGMLDGYRPGDPVVRVFTYQADPTGRDPEQIAEEAFAICNGHASDAGGADLSRRYYERELRSLSFPGNSPCCSRSCCLQHCAVWPRLASRPPGERASCERQPGTRSAAVPGGVSPRMRKRSWLASSKVPRGPGHDASHRTRKAPTGPGLSGVAAVAGLAGVATAAISSSALDVPVSCRGQCRL